jgi:Zn-dependent peptidase ImmA (M78 family)
MAQSVRVAVQPNLLRWARSRAGLEVRDLETTFARYGDWESGKGQPTLRQLEEFAAKTHAPIGYLFLEEPPVEVLPITDFRTLDSGVTAPSPELLETVYAMQRRQEFVRELLTEEGAEKLPFVKSATLDSPLHTVTMSIRTTLGLQLNWARSCADWTSALGYLRQHIEEAGVLVMLNGVVGNNTNRPLNVDEFRGFVLVDEYAPLIFINNADAKSAQMFTLIHELAHVWLGQGGVSGQPELLPPNSSIERFCDRVAAEILVPSIEFEATWTSTPGANIDRIDALSRLFKVSPLVVARRALDLGFLSTESFREFYKVQVTRTKKASGGNYYTTAGARLGNRFPAMVYSAVQRGRIGYTDAYDLTDLRGKSFAKFGRDQGYLE